MLGNRHEISRESKIIAKIVNPFGLFLVRAPGCYLAVTAPEPSLCSPSVFYIIVLYLSTYCMHIVQVVVQNTEHGGQRGAAEGTEERAGSLFARAGGEERRLLQHDLAS